ncbi:MAG: hypothetical protein MUO31_11315 [Thermodesulfovibrionales bacterium]|nr:hypothetical protein [Thermodesulfovibrionales bacterium]
MGNNYLGNKEQRYKVILFLLLGFNLIFKLLIFYNTNSFYVSEAGSNYGYLQAIEKGMHPMLFQAGYRSILAYIGYFFKSLTGTLGAFFWFQALVSTLSIYILYLICLRLTNEKTSALFAVLLATIFMDYHLLTPVFYYQIFEIFFVLLVVYLVLWMIDGNKPMRSAAVLLVPLIIYISVFFRGTLGYFAWLLIGMSLYFVLRKEYRLFAKLAAAGMITMILFSMLPQGNYKNKNIVSVNDFKFYGHTLYGGDGGEGRFIYEENEARYQKRLNEFMREHNYDSPTIQVRNEFQSREIREFILKSPHKWLWLQARKVAFTFGIVPVRDSLELLSTGKLHMKWYLSAFIIQAPYVIILLGFIVLIVLFFRISDLNNGKFLFLMLVLFYLIASTCLYGHYQERYRHVVILAGILPVSAFYFCRLADRSSMKSIARIKNILLVLILLIIFSHWGYQAYNALVVNKGRYLKAVNQFYIL